MRRYLIFVACAASLVLATFGWTQSTITKVVVTKQGDGAIVRVSGNDLPEPKVARKNGNRAWIASFPATLKTGSKFVSIKNKMVRYVQYGWYTSKPPVVNVLAWIDPNMTPTVTQEPNGDWVIGIGVEVPATSPDRHAAKVKTAAQPTLTSGAIQTPVGDSASARLSKPAEPTVIVATGKENLVDGMGKMQDGVGALPKKKTKKTNIIAAKPKPKVKGEFVAERTEEGDRTERANFGEQGPGVSLDFTNTSIVQILKALAAQTGSNIVTAPDVTGNLTISLKGESLTNALDLVTTLSGYKYVKEGNTYIVGKPEYLTRWTGSDTPQPGEEQRVVTEIYFAKYRDAADLARLFVDDDKTKSKSLVPGISVMVGGKDIMPSLSSSIVNETKEDVNGVGSKTSSSKEVAGQGTRQIIVTGPRGLVNQAMAILDRVDVPDPIVTQLYVSRSFTATELQAMLTNNGGNAMGVRATPMGSGQISLAGPKNAVNDAIRMLAEMEPTTAAQQIVMKTYTVKYVDSRDLAAYFTGPGSLVNGVQVRLGAAGIMPAVNLPGTKLDVAAQAGAGTGGTTGKAPSAGNSNAGNQSNGPTGNQGGNQGGNESEQLGNIANAQKTGEKRNTHGPRTLIVRGTEDRVDEAIEMMTRLDKAPPQVVIEAKVMDVLRDDLDKLGIQWDVFNNGVLNLQTVEKVTTTQSQTNGTNNNTTNTDKNGNSTNTNGNDQTNGNSWNKTFGPIGDPIVQAFNLSLNPRSFLGSINGFLDALVTNKRSRLLASPKVSVIDGEKTEIFIGDLVKYIESQSQTPQGTTFQIGTVNAGIQLAAVPRVSSDGWITLAIHPEVSLISAFNDVPGGGKLPQISTRYMDTTVRLRDGATLVIGGLIREEDIETITHTPILADLPVLGQFFRHRSKSKVSSEVVIFITVRIAE